MSERELFDRMKLRLHPLSERENRADILKIGVDPEAPPPTEDERTLQALGRAAAAVLEARRNGRPVIAAFGAHTIKNGLGPVLADLAERGFITHLATNGAGVIHDWEFACQGKTSEHVAENTTRGRFGLWDETGRSINLALISGAWRGLGYGEAVGAFIAGDGCRIPSREELAEDIRLHTEGDPGRCAAAADFLDVIISHNLSSGLLSIGHPFREYSLQYRAYRAGIPFTAHPMFGHDIIYTHPMSRGGAIGRTAERDFLSFAASVGRIDGGVYLSVGSAVMSPMIFEKSFSMAQNIALQSGQAIRNHRIFVVDLAPSSHDWSLGEPADDDPAYYLRFLKTFSRMGGKMEYIRADNRSFFTHLGRMLLPS